MTNPEGTVNVAVSRDRATPSQLAEEVMKVVGGVDDYTARAALDITGILLTHRKMAELDFQELCINEQL